MGSLLPLKRWSFQDARFRRETLDQVDTVLHFVRGFVEDRVGESAPDRDALIAAANQRAFTALLHSFLRGIPNTASARQTWERALELAPRSRARATCPPIFVDFAVGKEFFDLFNFRLSTREARDHKDPHFTAFGYLVEGLSRDQLRQLVDGSLSQMPELQEVTARAGSSSSSLSSS